MTVPRGPVGREGWPSASSTATWAGGVGGGTTLRWLSTKPLAVAATAETASGLDASVPLWMVAGVGLTLASHPANVAEARTSTMGAP